MNRRSFLQLSAAVITTPGVLMPVREIWTPRIEKISIPLAHKAITYVFEGELLIKEVEHEDLYVNLGPLEKGEYILRTVHPGISYEQSVMYTEETDNFVYQDGYVQRIKQLSS